MTRCEVIIQPEAEAEIQSGQIWYDGHAKGLVRDFLEAVDAALAAVQAHPLGYHEVYPVVRRAVLGRFPYSLF